MTWKQVLDRAQSLAALDALAADADATVELLAAELSGAGTLAELEARDAALAGALAEIDAVAVRAMRVRLDHALFDDTSLAAPTRKVFASTIVAYASALELLATRARELAARGRAADPDHVARRVVEAGRASLALRDGLRVRVLELSRERAAAAIAGADGHARDRRVPDPERKRWSAARRELEALVEDPGRVADAPFAARLAALPEQLDEPAAQPEPSFAELIELD